MNSPTLCTGNYQPGVFPFRQANMSAMPKSCSPPDSSVSLVSSRHHSRAATTPTTVRFALRSTPRPPLGSLGKPCKDILLSNGPKFLQLWCLVGSRCASAWRRSPSSAFWARPLTSPRRERCSADRGASTSPTTIDARQVAQPKRRECRNAEFMSRSSKHRASRWRRSWFHGPGQREQSRNPKGNRKLSLTKRNPSAAPARSPWTTASLRCRSAIRRRPLPGVTEELSRTEQPRTSTGDRE